MEHWLANAVVAVRPWAAWAGTMLASWLAWRIYAVAGGLAAVGLSLWNANQHREFIVEVSNPRGPKPTTRRGTRRRLRRIEQLIKDKQGEAIRQALLVLFYGFLVPSTVLGLAIYFYPWFMPGQDALSLAGCPRPANVAPTLLGTGMFVFSQLAMGMANTASSLADGALANVLPGYTPANGAIAAALVGYRYFIGLFAGSFAHLVYAAMKMPAHPELVRQRQELEAALGAADH